MSFKGMKKISGERSKPTHTELLAAYTAAYDAFIIARSNFVLACEVRADHDFEIIGDAALKVNL